MASVGEVAAAIREVVDRLRDSHRALSLARRGLDSAGSRTAGATEGSSSTEAEAVVIALCSASESAAAVQDHMVAAVEGLNRYLVDIGAKPSISAHADRASAGPQTEQEPPCPAAVGRFARRLPARTSDKSPVHGFLVAPNGSAIPVTSGKNMDTVSDLLRTYRPIAVDHAEGRAARQMRRYAVTKADLVINDEPCNYPQVGCRDAVPEMLPEGSTLTIWVREADGSLRYFGTCRGNGKGIRSR